MFIVRIIREKIIFLRPALPPMRYISPRNEIVEPRFIDRVAKWRDVGNSLKSEKSRNGGLATLTQTSRKSASMWPLTKVNTTFNARASWALYIIRELLLFFPYHVSISQSIRTSSTEFSIFWRLVVQSYLQNMNSPRRLNVQLNPSLLM